MRLGIDIDGVMYRWDLTARYMLREVLPNSPYSKFTLGGTPQGESTHWNDIQDHLVDPAHWKWLWTEGVRLGLFRYGHLYSGTIKTMRDLADRGHKLVIITHRPQQAVGDTLDWLAFQKLPYANVHILVNQESKAEVRPMCDIYLDDKPENCDDFYALGRPAVCIMDRPWNQKYQHHGVHRVVGWDGFAAKVRELGG